MLKNPTSIVVASINCILPSQRSILPSISPVKTARIICPLRIREISGRGGQCIRPDRLPAYQVRTRLDDNDLVVNAGNGESKIVSLYTGAIKLWRLKQFRCRPTAKS